MRKKLIMASMAAVVALGASAPALALDGGSAADNTRETLRGAEQKIQDTAASTTSQNKAGVQTVAERVRSQTSQIEDHRAELKQKLEQRMSERKQKLEGRRLAQCQNREANINSLKGKSASVGKQRLARIQQFEEGVKAFYVKQELSSDAYVAAVADVDEKESAAIAAVDTYAALKFDCSSVDVNDASGDLRESRTAAKDGLKAYRSSVVELLKVVKDAFVVKKADDSSEATE